MQGYGGGAAAGAVSGQGARIWCRARCASTRHAVQCPPTAGAAARLLSTAHLRLQVFKLKFLGAGGEEREVDCPDNMYMLGGAQAAEAHAA